MSKWPTWPSANPVPAPAGPDLVPPPNPTKDQQEVKRLFDQRMRYASPCYQEDLLGVINAMLAGRHFYYVGEDGQPLPGRAALLCDAAEAILEEIDRRGRMT